MLKRVVLWGVVVAAFTILFFAPAPLQEGAFTGSSIAHAQGAGVGDVVPCGGIGGRSCTLAERITNPAGFVYQSWIVVRGSINILLIIALLAVSFSNILRLNIDSYTVKKALPNLLIGVVLANASLFIIRYMADLATVVSYFFVESSNLRPDATYAEFLGQALSQILRSATGVGGVWAVFSGASALIIIIAILVAAIMLLWLAFLLYIRLVAIFLLTILAPFAFIAYGIPGMDKYFRQWWQQFVKWLFMLPAMSAVFWLMILIGDASGGEDSIAELLIMYVLLAFALTIPSKLGGSVINKATEAFKKAGPLSQNLGYDAALAGSNLSKKGKDLGGFKGFAARAGGGLLKGVGGTVSAPTTVKMGLERRWKGKQKAREYIAKQSKTYKRFAGKEARYMDAMDKQFEDMNGMSADDIWEELKAVDDDGEVIPEKKALQDWFKNLDPKDRHNLLTTPFNSWLAASKNPPPGDLEDAGKFAAALKRYNMESRRRTQRVGGAEALKNAGWDHDALKAQQQEQQGNPYGNIPGLSAAHLAEINDGIRRGQTPEEIAAGVSVKYNLDPAQVAAAAKDLEADIHLQPHIDHFAGNFGPAASREIAEAGAELSEQFDEAFESKSNPSFDNIIARSQDFLKKAGYFGAPDLGGDKEPAERAAEMQRKVRLVSRGANAVANNQAASAVNKLGSSIESLGSQLEQLAGSGSSPEQQASMVRDNEQVNQAITNNITQQAQTLNRNLSAEDINSISQSVKNSLLTGLTEKHTLKRIFGSERFQQTLKNTILSSGIGTQAPSAPPNAPSEPPEEPPAPENTTPPQSGA